MVREVLPLPTLTFNSKFPFSRNDEEMILKKSQQRYAFMDMVAVVIVLCFYYVCIIFEKTLTFQIVFLTDLAKCKHPLINNVGQAN